MAVVEEVVVEEGESTIDADMLGIILVPSIVPVYTFVGFDDTALSFPSPPILSTGGEGFY